MSFWNLLRAEWTKLHSVRRWAIALGAAGVLSVLLTLVVAAGNKTNINEYTTSAVGPTGRPVIDQLHFVHQTMTGDGGITAHVVSQENTNEWAAAGLMIKDGTTSGSRFAAVNVTPKHGVQLRTNYTTDIAGPAAGQSWLRLTRAGATITGYASSDGTTWHQIGTLTKTGLADTVEIGLFVNSPPTVTVVRQAGSTSVGERPTMGEALFDNVTLSSGGAVSLHGEDIISGAGPKDAGSGRDRLENGTYRVSGSGRIGPDEPIDDMVQTSLFGVIAGVITLIAVGALFMTAEFKRDMLRTTFAASPRRGGVLAAKAIVLGTTAFGIGLVASLASFFVAQPLLHRNGWTRPAFPPPSLTEGPVLRAILTTAVFVAAIALLSLGVAAITRHSAAAITTVVVLVVLPFILGAVLPPGAARWLMQLTPSGGLATQRAKPPTSLLADPTAALNPWIGLSVTCLYSAAALAGAWWLLRRRDT